MSAEETRFLPELYTAGSHGEPGHSAGGPIFGLDHHAPPLPSQWFLYDVDHPISNDDSAATFGQTVNRQFSPEYQGVKNRVAAIVGESALMASIRYMPEDTILIVDRSPAMIAYMARYVSALRASADIGEWYGYMGFSEQSREYPANIGEIVRNIYQLQAEYWTRAGYNHPAVSGDAFEEAKEQAQQKVIIPWRADITESRDMSQLGKALRAYDASITFLNLTNVLACVSSIRSAEQAADLLDGLPFTSDVPIVLSTEADESTPSDFKFTHPTRLFFGLDDLRLNGGVTDIDSPLRGSAVNAVVRS